MYTDLKNFSVVLRWQDCEYEGKEGQIILPEFLRTISRGELKAINYVNAEDILFDSINVKDKFYFKIVEEIYKNNDKKDIILNKLKNYKKVKKEDIPLFLEFNKFVIKCCNGILGSLDAVGHMIRNVENDTIICTYDKE